MVRPPWLQALPTESMATFTLHADKERKKGTNFTDKGATQYHFVSLEAAFILLNLCVTVGAPLSYLGCKPL